MKSIKLGSFYALLVVQLFACKSIVTVQTKQLNDAMPAATAAEPAEINVYSDYLDKFSWVSPEPTCIEIKNENKEVQTGKNAIHLKWDKITGGCKWLGVGFGAGNWQTKDFSEIAPNTALQLHIKSVKGNFKNLPVAFAFEDNFGVQAYYGFRLELASGEFTDTSWTAVTIPLSKFDFKSQHFNLERITQFIIQLEADGNIYIDNIKFIPLKNG